MKSYKDFISCLSEEERIARADYKVAPSGRKSHREIVFKDGESEEEDKEQLKREQFELEEKFINGREYASNGLMHPDHAKMDIHKVSGHHVDFYASKTGDKMQGKVTKNDGKEVHIQAHKELGDGKLHKFKVSSHLPVKEEVELDEAMTPQQKTDFDRMMAGAMSRAAYNAKWKKPLKSDSKVIYGKNVKEEVAVDEQAPVAPTIDRKYIKGTPEWKAHKEKSKPINGHPTNVKEESEIAESADDEHYAKQSQKMKDAINLHLRKGKSYKDAVKAAKVHVKEDVKLSEGAYGPFEKSEENKRSAFAAKKQGDMFAHHLHMADHHDNLAQWHAEKGRHNLADSHAAKSEEHHAQAMKLKEEVEQLDEISADTAEKYFNANANEKRKGASDLGLSKKEMRVAHNRVVGSNRALDRMYRRHKLQGYKESVIHEEETMEKLTYKEFLAKLDEQLLEYDAKSGVYRHKGSYGSSYQGDDDEDDKPAKPAEPAVKRGRGRPAGSKSGARQKGSTGKSYGGIAIHSLNLPNKNK